MIWACYARMRRAWNFLFYTKLGFRGDTRFALVGCSALFVRGGVKKVAAEARITRIGKKAHVPQIQLGGWGKPCEN